MARLALPLVAFAAALCFLLAPLAAAHGRHVEGTILVATPDQLDTGLFALVESVAPGAAPNGVFYYAFDATAGESFSVDTGQRPFVVGTASSCPGPRADSNGDLGDDDGDGEFDHDADRGDFGLPDDVGGENSAVDNRIDLVDFWLEDPKNNVWVLCNNTEIWIRFSSGECHDSPSGDPLPGDPCACGFGGCSGIVPGEPGEAVRAIVYYFTVAVAVGFVYHEGF